MATKEFLNTSIDLIKRQQKVVKLLYYNTNNLLTLEEYQELEVSLIKVSSLFSKVLAKIYRLEVSDEINLPVLPSDDSDALSVLFEGNNDDDMNKLLNKYTKDDEVTLP